MLTGVFCAVLDCVGPQVPELQATLGHLRLACTFQRTGAAAARHPLPRRHRRLPTALYHRRSRPRRLLPHQPWRQRHPHQCPQAGCSVALCALRLRSLCLWATPRWRLACRFRLRPPHQRRACLPRRSWMMVTPWRTWMRCLPPLVIMERRGCSSHQRLKSPLLGMPRAATSRCTHGTPARRWATRFVCLPSSSP